MWGETKSLGELTTVPDDIGTPEELEPSGFRIVDHLGIGNGDVDHVNKLKLGSWQAIRSKPQRTLTP